MKSIVIHEVIPDDDFGHSGENWGIFNTEQCHVVGSYCDWEDGNSIDSVDFVLDDDFKVFVFNKMLEYLETNENWADDDGDVNCHVRIHDSEEAGEEVSDILKDTSVTDFVNDYAGYNRRIIDFENMDSKYRHLFRYFNMISRENIFLDCIDYSDGSADISEADDMKARIIEEWNL